MPQAGRAAGRLLPPAVDFTLQTIPAGLIHAGLQRPVLCDGRVFAGTTERTRGSGLQASALFLQPDNARFQLTNSLHIAELLMFFFVGQAALGQGCFQLFLFLTTSLLRGLQLLLTLAKRQQAAMQRRKLLA